MTALQLRGVSISRDDRVLASQVSGVVMDADLVVLTGANGTGKSTLLSQIIGALPTTRGSITLDGTAIRTLPDNVRARKLAYIEQLWTPALDYTVEQVVSWSIRLHGEKSAVQEALAMTEAEHLRERTVTTLSGGERARVGLARAIAQRSALVLLDEPTAAVDHQGRELFARIIADMRARGIGFLIATHDSDLINTATGRIALT